MRHALAVLCSLLALVLSPSAVVHPVRHGHLVAAAIEGGVPAKP